MRDGDSFQVRLVITTAIMATMFAGFAGLWGFLNMGGASPRAFTNENLLRLHVVANSNSAQDQDIKLQVRDAVLREAGEIFDGVATQEEAIKIIEDNLPRLERAARITLASEQPVVLRLDRSYFPHREYGQMALPAGDYHALQVVIGRGQGENWWCVLFPPLCFLEDKVVEVDLTGKEGTISYALRWKTWDNIARNLEPLGKKALSAGKEGLSNLLLGIPLWHFSMEQ